MCFSKRWCRVVYFSLQRNYKNQLSRINFFSFYVQKALNSVGRASTEADLLETNNLIYFISFSYLLIKEAPKHTFTLV